MLYTVFSLVFPVYILTSYIPSMHLACTFVAFILFCHGWLASLQSAFFFTSALHVYSQWGWRFTSTYMDGWDYGGVGGKLWAHMVRIWYIRGRSSSDEYGCN